MKARWHKWLGEFDPQALVETGTPVRPLNIPGERKGKRNRQARQGEANAGRSDRNMGEGRAVTGAVHGHKKATVAKRRVSGDEARGEAEGRRGRSAARGAPRMPGLGVDTGTGGAPEKVARAAALKSEWAELLGRGGNGAARAVAVRPTAAVPPTTEGGAWQQGQRGRCR